MRKRAGSWLRASRKFMEFTSFSSLFLQKFIYTIYFPHFPICLFAIFLYTFLYFFFMTCQVGLRHGKFGYGIEVSKATALAIYGCGTLARGWWWTAGTKTCLTSTNIPIRTTLLSRSFLFCWHFAKIPRSSFSVDSFHFFLPPKEIVTNHDKSRTKAFWPQPMWVAYEP